MINKPVSKITVLSAMLLAGVVNAQEFYTCVPKKNWWKDTIKESVPSVDSLKNVIRESVKNGIKDEKERFVFVRAIRAKETYIDLQPGSYRILYGGDILFSFDAFGGSVFSIGGGIVVVSNGLNMKIGAIPQHDLYNLYILK